MDKFEETILSMIGMSPVDRAESDEKFSAMCTCPSCPTYNRCAKNAQELLFCSAGWSRNAKSRWKNDKCAGLAAPALFP